MSLERVISEEGVPQERGVEREQLKGGRGENT